MKAIVLVGGFGTRLRPLTLHTPKQMLPVVDRPMIEWVLAHLAEHGIDEAVLSLGYRPDAFEDAYPDGQCAGVALQFAVDPEPLDTAGAIRFAARQAGVDERMVVVNGDVLTDLDVGALVAFHDAAGAEGTIALHQVDDPSRYGVVPTDDDGRVQAFVEKPPAGEEPSDRINAGTYVLEPSALERIPEGRVSIERATFPAMVADGTLFAMDDGGVYWLDGGTPETYLAAQLDLTSGRRSIDAPPAVSTAAWIDREASVEGSVVQRAAMVRGGATVKGSVLLPGCVIGEGAMVLDSIVGPGAIIGEGAVVRELSVIGDGAVVADGEVLAGVRFPDEEG